MPLDAQTAREDFTPQFSDQPRPRWGASSETGRLTDVLLSAPPFLKMVPCNDVSRENLAQGHRASPAAAARQHRAFADALQRAGVRCHFVAPRETMPDLSFTRDAVLMSPWGLIELRPAAHHRRAETDHVAAAVEQLGVQIHDSVDDGRVEGGDVCLLRDGVVVIGYSNERTDQAGADALGAIFERRGWEVIKVAFDAQYLHLDTIFTMVDDDIAVACPAALDRLFLDRLEALGIRLIAASTDEVASLSANLLSLGDGRIVAASHGERINARLAAEGVEVIEADIDQFTRCGGGPHCLTMPLARLPAE